MKRDLLDETALQQALHDLSGWGLENRKLIRTFEFPTYLAGIEFVRQVALLAERLNHHPDLQVGWRKVTAHLTTHSAGGLTALDVELARGMQEVFSSN